jgi:MFS family permease
VYVFEQTGLATAATLMMLCAFLSNLLLTPLAGVLADRYDRRLLMILGDGLSALGLVYILLCMQNGGAALWQIGIGVTVSSVFSSLTEPSFKATISDLLTKEEYTKAGGFVGLINSARFLVSPVIAGALLAVSDIRVLLVIDGCTLILTVLATFVVRRGLVSKATERGESFLRDFKAGWLALTKNRGVLVLTVTGIAMTFFIGCVQSLCTPMLLGFMNSSAAGTATTLSATGMLVSSLLLGAVPIKKGFVRIMCAATLFEGLCMMGFGTRENIVAVCISGFLFFAAMPFANTCIDYLIRTNIPNKVQGRVWGLIGLISQFGFIIAYSVLGPLADSVFVPALKEGGALALSLGKLIGTGPGRGIGLLIILCGILLAVLGILLYQIRSVRNLDKGAKHVR